MSLTFNYDYWNNLEIPSFILCNVDKTKIGKLTVSDRHLKYNNEIPEISFKIYKYIDGKENTYYDRVLELQYILLENIGYFQITQKPITVTDKNVEYKEVTAQSTEIEFGQKYINTFTINMGTVESIDGVCLYQAGDQEHSLLNLVLEKLPSWTIGYVDPKIATLQRSFEIDNQDVYSFLTSNVSEAFGCIFIFDTLLNTINVYDKDAISEDTNIVISFNNLAKQVKIEPDIDSIKTCLTLIGDDDLTVRELNMGYDRIYNFDYFVSPEYMGNDLITAYENYKVAYQQCREQYTPLITQYQNLIIEIAKLDHEMLPTTPLPLNNGQLVTTEELANDKTVWNEYCLTELKTYKKAYEERQSVLMQKGYGDSSKSEYNTLYLPVYTILQNINAEITVRENQIAKLENQKTTLNVQMQNIIQMADIQNNFTEEQWLYLSKFIREETLNDSNYIVTDSMTQEETLDMKQAFLDFGNEQLLKISQPQFSFSLDMANIFAIPEFKNQLDNFQLFNYITVLIRDDYYMKVKILSFDIDFEDKKNFSVTFGSIYKYKNKDVFTTAVDAMATASSASTSVSFNKFQWNNGTEDAFNIKGMISSGLINSGVSLINSKSTMSVDERGMFMNNDIDSDYPDDKAALTGSNLLFTTDNWKTVRTALGRINYTKADGAKISTYGLIAETVLSGYVGGTLIEGNTIKGNAIIGNTINNGNGTFSVDVDGNVVATSATIKGTISSSKISASEITGTSINNGNGTFVVDSNGNVIAKSITISGGSISITNNNDTSFMVDNTGKLIAKNADITGSIVTDNITATKGSFTNVTIGQNCVITGDCTIMGRVLGSGFTWNGNGITQDYINSVLGSAVGSGINADNISVGTLVRPYVLNGISIVSNGNNELSCTTGVMNCGELWTGNLVARYPSQVGGTQIGTSSHPYNVGYITAIHGSLSSSSSRDLKTNIENYDIKKCIDVINNTQIVSYNYKDDIKDNTEAIKIIENEKQEYINYIANLDKNEKPSDEIYATKIKSYDDRIFDLSNERKTKPETRYGFIAEDAPWELVSMDRKSVDTYSAVAMCFGAIQLILKRLSDIEEKIKNET